MICVCIVLEISLQASSDVFLRTPQDIKDLGHKKQGEEMKLWLWGALRPVVSCDVCAGPLETELRPQKKMFLPEEKPEKWRF